MMIRRYPLWSLLLLLCSGAAFSQDDVVEIELVTDNPHGAYYFQPAGVYVDRGQKLRFISTHYTHTVTAFHPDNGNAQTRIPKGAKPFDVVLGDEADGAREVFEIRLDRPGIYDFYCRLHAAQGEIGRIVVGEAGDRLVTPADRFDAPARPAGYAGLSIVTTRLPVAQALFDHLNPDAIVEQRELEFPAALMQRFGRAYHAPNEPIAWPD